MTPDALPFKDYFSGHAADYQAFRPDYPPDLFAYLAGVSPGRELAWDCGTGNGQAAVSLAEYFDRVIATDASADQIAQARPHPRVEFLVGPAEHAPLPDSAADLITVAQAFHWFDFERFFAEARRVTKPGGVLAVWTYAYHRVNPAVDRMTDRLEAEFTHAYWPAERQHVFDRYASVPFPFEELPAPRFELTQSWTLPALLGYLNTWSATKRFIAANGFNPVEKLAGEFAAAWGDPAREQTVSWELHLRVGRVHTLPV
jgi:SAM-dependent methyltransferase